MLYSCIINAIISIYTLSAGLSEANKSVRIMNKHHNFRLTPNVNTAWVKVHVTERQMASLMVLHVGVEENTEDKLVKDGMIRGYYIYQNVWTPTVDEWLAMCKGGRKHQRYILRSCCQWWDNSWPPSMTNVDIACVHFYKKRWNYTVQHFWALPLLQGPCVRWHGNTLPTYFMLKHIL